MLYMAYKMLERAMARGMIQRYFDKIVPNKIYIYIIYNPNYSNKKITTSPLLRM